MTSSRLQLGSLIFGGCLTFALATGPAMAAPRSAVALAGSDSGTCALTAPCRTLAYALTQTPEGGELLVMDSAGFGPITITQAVTIVAPPGEIAFISAPSGDAVTVNAGASDTVILENFFIDGMGTGSNGVTVNTAGSFSLSGSTVTGFTGNAINYVINESGTTHLTLNSDALYKNTQNAVLIKPAGGGGSVYASIHNGEYSSTGITIDNTSSASSKIGVSIFGTVIRYMSGAGVTANSGGVTGIFVQAFLNKAIVFDLTTGLVANGANAQIGIADSGAFDITTLAVSSGGGTVNSYGNNQINVASVGTLGSTPLQ